MMMQLNPPIPVDTPKGKGQANLIIDYGIEHDLYWVVFLDQSKECWTFSNRDIRAQTNYTIGRTGFPIQEDPNLINRKVAALNGDTQLGGKHFHG